MYPALSSLACSGGAGDTAPTASSRTSSPSPPLLSSGLIHVHVPVGRGRVDSIEASCYNANPAIEDSFVIEPLLQSDAAAGCAVGVFDGHSGAAASVWLRQHILGFIQHQWRTGRTDQLLHPRAFVDADAHFLESSWAQGRPADGLSGACYNVVQLSGREVRCASAGDVRAIVGRRRRLSAVPTEVEAAVAAVAGAVRDGRRGSTHIAVPLSWDHQIDVNPSERERLLAAHPSEADVIRRNRVKGRLQPTRGFGDAAYKQLRYYHHRTQMQQAADGGSGRSSRTSATAYTPPYTTGLTTRRTALRASALTRGAVRR